MMDAIAITLALVLFTTTIYLASADCGSIPTSRQDLESFYLGTLDCGYPYLERIFSQNRLLVDCNGDSATISTLEEREYRIILVALCTLPDGKCNKENSVSVSLLYGQSSSVISLPANSTDCLFGACGFGDDDNELVYVNLSKCAAVPVSTTDVAEYMIATPTNASTASQATTGTVKGSTNFTTQVIKGTADSIGPTSSTAPKATGGTLDRHSTEAIVSSVLIIIFVAVLLMLVLAVVAVSRRNTHWIIFPRDAKIKVTIQPVRIDVTTKMSNLHESIRLELYEHDNLCTPDGHQGSTLTANYYYQQRKFSTTIPSKVQNDFLVGRKATLTSIGNDYCQLGDSKLKQCLNQSVFATNEFEYIDEGIEGYTTNERNTDTPATLTRLMVDGESEVRDDDNYDRNLFRGLGGNQDILSSEKVPRSPCHNDPNEYVQEVDVSFPDDNMEHSVDVSMPPHYMDESDTSSSLNLSQDYHPPTDCDYSKSNIVSTI